MRRHAAALLCFVLVALLTTWPLALHITTTVPGDGVDAWQNIWNMWWLKRALLEGRNPFITDALYYPDGASLLLHTLNPFNFLVSLPFHALFGLIVAYNVALLFSLVASGYATYLLAEDVVGNQRAALLAGVVVASSGYLLAQVLGHLNLVAMEWVPFAVLALRRASSAPGVRTIGLAGLCLFLNVLCDWQYFLFALVWCGWYALALVRSQRSVRVALPVLLAGGVALLLVLPLLVPTAQLALHTPRADTGQSYRLGTSADLTDFLIPSQLHPLWGAAAARVQAYKAENIIHNKTAYLGTATLALAVVGVWGSRRQRKSIAPSRWTCPDFWHTPRFWVLSAALFCVLALGPQLHIGGVATGVPLPAALYYRLPFVNISRVPLRFLSIALLALAVLAAFGVRHLLESIRQCPRPARVGNMLLAVLIGLVLLDNMTAPYPLVGVLVPSVYAEMAQDGQDYAILESPFSARTSMIFMFYQAVHGKPLVGGILSRDMPYPLRDQFPIVRLFADAESPSDMVVQDMAEIAPSFFSYFNIGAIILHSEGGALRYRTVPRIAQAAAGGAEPERVTLPGRSFLVYRVQKPADPLPFVGVGQGWSEPHRLTDGTWVRTLTNEAELLIYSAQQSSVTMEMWVQSERAGTLRAEADGEPLPPQDVQSGGQRSAFPLDVPPGVTRLLLHTDGTVAMDVFWINLVKK